MIVLLGNPDPAGTLDVPVLDDDGHPQLTEDGQAVITAPAKVSMNVDDVDQILRVGPFPTEGWTFAEKIGAIVNAERGTWAMHSFADRPSWIASDSPAMLEALEDTWPGVTERPLKDALEDYRAQDPEAYADLEQAGL